MDTGPKLLGLLRTGSTYHVEWRTRLDMEHIKYIPSKKTNNRTKRKCKTRGVIKGGH